MPYQPVDGMPGRRDVDVRWQAIAAHLPTVGIRSLDVGCAEGWFTAKLAQRGPAIGIDRAVRESRHVGYELIKGRARARSLARLGSFDVVLLLSILHHMRDADDVLKWARHATCFVELPHPDEEGVAAKADLTGIRDILQAEATPLCETPGYDVRHRRTLWML